MKSRQAVIAILLSLAASVPLSARPRKAHTITAEQAKAHVGETAKVCGQVVRVQLAFRTRGQPTFLNLDKPYPHQVFTAVIWGLDRGKFGDPQQQYLNKHICVTGPITLYHNQPEIILHSPKQITVK